MEHLKRKKKLSIDRMVMKKFIFFTLVALFLCKVHAMETDTQNINGIYLFADSKEENPIGVFNINFKDTSETEKKYEAEVYYYEENENFSKIQLNAQWLKPLGPINSWKILPQHFELGLPEYYSFEKPAYLFKNKTSKKFTLDDKIVYD
jgi:hypothetical protein